MDFRGEKRTNDTHESTTDPDSKLYEKALGEKSRLSYLGQSRVAPAKIILGLQPLIWISGEETVVFIFKTFGLSTYFVSSAWARVG